MLMVRIILSYCYNYIKLVNGKVKIKLLLQLHSNIELMTEHDLRLDMCFPHRPIQPYSSKYNKLYYHSFKSYYITLNTKHILKLVRSTIYTKHE